MVGILAKARCAGAGAGPVRAAAAAAAALVVSHGVWVKFSGDSEGTWNARTRYADWIRTGCGLEMDLEARYTVDSRCAISQWVVMLKEELDVVAKQ